MVRAEPEARRLVNNLVGRQKGPRWPSASSPQGHRATRDFRANLASGVVFPRGDSSKSGLQGVCYGKIRISAEPTDEAGEGVECCYFLVSISSS